MSILTFNITSTNREFISKSDESFQIMPERLKVITKETITKFPESTKSKPIIIHAEYSVRIWKVDTTLKQELYVRGLIELAIHLKAQSILIHGPASYEEFTLFTYGLQWLNAIYSTYKSKYLPDIAIEIPAFTKDVHNVIDVNYDFIESYFNIIVAKNFKIVIDTAHAHANNLSTDDIINLLSKFKDNYDFIHLNGNKNQPKTRDEHCSLISKDNKISEHEKLLNFISSLHKICVVELSFKDVEYWKKFAEKFNFKIVSDDVLNLIG